uniref:Uncharacterized protein n=1 Tax=Trichinella nativa TaxID=6335 RepID=A0A0V1KJ69_9BILA
MDEFEFEELFKALPKRISIEPQFIVLCPDIETTKTTRAQL